MSSAPPDLASILSTLAQYSQAQPNRADQTSDTYSIPPADEISAGKGNATPDSFQEGSKDPLVRPQQRLNASARAMIDPATITAWPDALRCVTKIATQNARFATRIEAMMAEQRASEMRWYRERQDLKQTQLARHSSSAKAASILRGLTANGASDRTVADNKTMTGSTDASDDTEAANAAELAAFDRKIYAAQQGLETWMTAELKGLGVPFFGTDENLIVSDDTDTSDIGLPDGHPKWSPIVTESQLLALRRRMVGHLEDLYRS